MPTLTQLSEQGRALVVKQKYLVEDTRPWSQKRDEFDRIDADIKSIISQCELLQQVDGRAFHDVSSADQRRGRLTGLAAGLAAKGYRPIAAPQLVLDHQDAEALHHAAVSHRSLAVDIKATDSTSVTPAAIPDYRLPPVTMRREPTRVLSLLPSFATNHATVEWFTTTGTTAAAAVAEGGTKPTSTIAYTPQTTSATKLAHVAEVTDETLMDFSSFLSMLEADMVAGLFKAENAELLTASVTGAHKWPGLLNTTGILTRAKDSEPNNLDVISEGFDDLRNGTAYTDPDGIVMHPTDWGNLRRLKDGNDRYYLAPDPTRDASDNLWGVPVVLTTQMTLGTALIGAFAESVAVYVRDGIRVETANQGTTQFSNNTTLVRAEERLVLTVPRPTGLVKVTGL
jgi:HK97 family phage major capsid protein